MPQEGHWRHVSTAKVLSNTLYIGHQSPLTPLPPPPPPPSFCFLHRFAMKQLDKKRLKKEGQEMSVIHERNVLAEVSQFRSCTPLELNASSNPILTLPRGRYCMFFNGEQMTSKFVTNLK